MKGKDTQVCVWLIIKSPGQLVSAFTSHKSRCSVTGGHCENNNEWKWLANNDWFLEQCWNMGKQWKHSTQHNLYLENPLSPFSSVLSFIRDIWLRESSLFEIRSIWLQITAFLFCIKHARFLCTQRLCWGEHVFLHNIYASCQINF